MDAAEAIEGGVGLGREARAFAGGEDGGEVLDYKRGMGALGGMEVWFDAEMKIYGAGDEPDAFALGHLRRLFDFGEAEDAGIEGTGAVFAGDGDGDLHVIDAEDWHGCRSLNFALREIGHGIGGFYEFL